MEHSKDRHHLNWHHLTPIDREKDSFHKLIFHIDLTRSFDNIVLVGCDAFDLREPNI
jgi:hypothetical protein